jgi:pimeloyl-ACP methyl ester carboxylesterase
MSAITIDNDLVHYEVLGRGRPVILLHGWLGSWRYWVPVMRQLSGKYRTYAVDLWGFGDSGHDPKRFGFDAQVALLDEFMDNLGMKAAALIGHDLGAAIAVRYARQNPKKVPRLLAVSPPLYRMAPTSQALTDNRPDNARQLPPASPPRPETAAGTPAAAPSVAFSEAETMPWRSAELDKRIREAQQRIQAVVNDQVTPGAKEDTPAAAAPAKTPVESAEKPMSAQEATTPPTNQPATEIVSAATRAPGPLDSPSMPKTSYVQGEIQPPNPLKAHLSPLNPVELLNRHVEAGTDRDKLIAESQKAARDVMTVCVDSFAGVDTLGDMKLLERPLVMVYGQADTFLPLQDEGLIDDLRAAHSQFQAIGLDGAKHFPMLENIAIFSRLLLDFLEAPDVTKLVIKETWERRVR